MRSAKTPARGTLALVLSTLLLAACGGEAPAGDGPGSLTRTLLDARAQETREPPSPLRDVPVAELGFDFGSVDAPVRVVELSDFGCGYCRRFHLETWPALRDEFVETGRVEWKFVPYVTGMFENSLEATRAAECTLEQGEDLYVTFTERLWAEQPEWKGSDAPRALLRGWAEHAGADVAGFDDCMTSGRRFERVAAAGGLARQLAVRGTPTFFVVGYGPLQGALPVDVFRDLLTQVYARETEGGA